MIKKLFTIFGMICVALTSFGQPKHVVADWDSNSNTLTLDFTDVKGPELDHWYQEVTNAYPGCVGNVENLTISGNFSNKDFLEKMTDNLKSFGSSMNVNMSGCTGVVARYDGFSEVGGATGDENEQVVTNFKVFYPGMTNRTDDVEVRRLFFYKGNDVTSNVVGDENGKYTYVTGKYLDEKGNVYNGTPQEDENGYYYLGLYDIDKGVEYIGAAWNPAEGLLTEPNTGRKYYMDENIEILTDPLPDGFNPNDIINQLKIGQTPSGYNGTGWDSEDPTIFNYYDWSESHNLIQFKVTRHYVEENHRFDLTKEIVFLSPQDLWCYEKDGQLNIVASSDVTDKTDEDKVGSTGKYKHDVGGDVFHLGNLGANVKSFVCPDNDNFTFIVALSTMFASNTKLESVTLSDKIKALDSKAFLNCTGLTSINFPASLEQIGGDCFNTCTGLTSVNLSATKLDRVRFHTFNDCSNLAEVTFPANTLVTIQTQAFQRTAIVNLDLSDCHKLRVIGQKAFENVKALQTVTVCSHPKVIRGTEGSGAFNNCTNINTVEVVGCKDAPNLTLCICENNAFSPDITYVQTQVESVETKGARLIFPQDDFWNDAMAADAGNVDNAYMGYASAFDFFVGDYKKGVYTGNQSNIEAYYRFAPKGQHASAVESITGTTKDAYCASDNKMASTYGIGNGWHEFMNIAEGTVLKKNEEFLRTYSRTEDSGPILLDKSLGITAYRAVDFISKGLGYVESWKGNLVYVDADHAPEGVEPGYYTKTECANMGIEIKGLPTYTECTTGGTLYLRALRPKLKGSNEVDEEISYVPEGTGVVLYSQGINESVFLIWDSYSGDKYDLSVQYPHTGKDRRESTRMENEPDDINMLQGSYGVDTFVSPVEPWNQTTNRYDRNNILFRDFAYHKVMKRWLRLQPGIIKYNRAYAKIPAGIFDNPNESAEADGASPIFTLNDMPSSDLSDSEGANIMVVLDTSFDEQVIDGIRVIDTNTKQVVDADAWYTLQGVKVARPAQGGLYIHNNKKVVIK